MPLATALISVISEPGKQQQQDRECVGNNQFSDQAGPKVKGELEEWQWEGGPCPTNVEPETDRAPFHWFIPYPQGPALGWAQNQDSRTQSRFSRR